MSTDPPTTIRRQDASPPLSGRPRLVRRALIGAGAAVLLAALVLGALALFAESDAEQTAERFGAAWAADDYPAMYAMLDGRSQEDVPEDEFADAYTDAAGTTTATAIEPQDASEDEEGEVLLPVAVSTRAFGTITGDVHVPISRAGEIEWEPHLVFPGLAEGEELSRKTAAPERAPLLASDGTILAEGRVGDRTSELAADAAAVAGAIGSPATREQRESLFVRGFPPGTGIGTTGLERVFEEELAGTPGGVLRAGDREIAASEPQPAAAVRTTIDPDLQESAALALTRLGGIVAIDVSSGRIEALAGDTTTTAQPPGSTFKLVTTTAALEADLVSPSTEFPVETAALIDGVTIDNAGQSACGGSFAESFAESCNSVFAPLGVDVGAEELVAAAERYGVNQPPQLPNVDGSTMPQADEFESDLELGATAIGQGRLLMTPIDLAAVTQTIANDGGMVAPTLDPDAPPERTRITTRDVADTIEDLMVGVTAPGATGENATIAGVEVAGKTGTAELGEGIVEHAWFTAFAPASTRRSRGRCSRPASGRPDRVEGWPASQVR